MKELFDMVLCAIGFFLLLIIFYFAITFPPLGIALVIIFYWINKKDKQKKLENIKKEKALLKKKQTNERSEILNKAKNGDTEAAFKYGEAVRDGYGGGQDEKNGFRWIHYAATLDNASAQFQVAKAYEHGIGVEADELKAFEWYKRAYENEVNEALTGYKRTQQSILQKQDDDQVRIAMGVSPQLWPSYKRILDICESPPEKLLLKAFVKEFDLAPSGDYFVGIYSIEPQAHILSFRVDFLVNKSLVVEVDGKAYHANSTSFENDRRRDQELALVGYQTIRFTARQVFQSPTNCVSIIRNLIELKSDRKRHHVVTKTFDDDIPF